MIFSRGLPFHLQAVYELNKLMTSKEPVSREYRKQLARSLFKITEQELPEASNLTSTQTLEDHVIREYEVLGDDPTDPYLLLACRLFLAFNEQAAVTDNAVLADLARQSSVFQGFRTIGRILRFAPPAYLEWTADENRPADAEELRAILHNSSRVLRRFTDADESTAFLWEVNFDLAGLSPVYEDLPFTIEAAEGTGLQFTTSLQSEINTRIDKTLMLYTGALSVAENFRGCPARGQVLDQQWHLAVDQCAQNPELFAQDLA